MPRICLEEILLEVVLHDGDATLLTLALVCSSFKDIVSNKWFRERAHFLWLDSVATWSKFSSMYKQEFYTMYSVQNCCATAHLRAACQVMLDVESWESSGGFIQTIPTLDFAASSGCFE